MSESEPDGFLLGKIVIEFTLTMDGETLVSHKIDTPDDAPIAVATLLGGLDLVHDAILHPEEDPDM